MCNLKDTKMFLRLGLVYSLWYLEVQLARIGHASKYFTDDLILNHINTSHKLMMGISMIQCFDLISLAYSGQLLVFLK